MTWIAISGSHYVGKSTVIDDAVVGRSDVQVIGRVMRELAAAGVPVGADSDLSTMARYVELQMPAEEDADRARPLLSDRVLLDGLCYVLAARDNGTAKREWTEDEIVLVRALARRQMAVYDLHVLIPIEFPLAGDDALHRGGEELRQAVENHIEAETSSWPVPVQRIDGDRADRARQLGNLLGTGGAA